MEMVHGSDAILDSGIFGNAMGVPSHTSRFAQHSHIVCEHPLDGGPLDTGPPLTAWSASQAARPFSSSSELHDLSQSMNKQQRADIRREQQRLRKLYAIQARKQRYVEHRAQAEERRRFGASSRICAARLRPSRHGRRCRGLGNRDGTGILLASLALQRR